MSKLPNLMSNLNKIMDLAEPYMKRGVSEDWQEFIATVQKTGMEAEQAIEAYIAERTRSAECQAAANAWYAAADSVTEWPPLYNKFMDRRKENLDEMQKIDQKLKSNERSS